MRWWLVVSCLWCGLAFADKVAPKAAPPAFPTVAGTRYTFAGHWDNKSATWTTTLAAAGDDFQYSPTNDIANYFSKAGLRVASDGIYIRGESLDEPEKPALAIALPLKVGDTRQVPGLIPTQYKVLSHAKLKVGAGTFDAWKIEISDKPNGKGAVWIAPGTGVVKIQLPTGRIDELAKIEPPK